MFPIRDGPGIRRISLDPDWIRNRSPMGRAGAGLDAVLDSDADMLPYLAPGGSTAGWAANQYLNAREIPIALQLRDWNSWLPQVHPVDAYGASFTQSGMNDGLPVNPECAGPQ